MSEVEHYECKECGQHVTVDEDECCKTCGGDCLTSPCECVYFVKPPGEKHFSVTKHIHALIQKHTADQTKIEALEAQVRNLKIGVGSAARTLRRLRNWIRCSVAPHPASWDRMISYLLSASELYHDPDYIEDDQPERINELEGRMCVNCAHYSEEAMDLSCLDPEHRSGVCDFIGGVLDIELELGPYSGGGNVGTIEVEGNFCCKGFAEREGA